MAKVIEVGEYKPRICDSATGASCETEKVVDITEDCPRASVEEPAVLLFTRAKRGRIVQIRWPYRKDKVNLGTSIHFFVDELHHYICVAARDDTFATTADRLGVTKVALRALIETYVPA